MKINFLQGTTTLTKAYKKTKTGIEKTSYPHMFEVTSHEADVTTVRGFAEVLRKHAALGHCLLKGELTRTLKHESRAGTTDRNGNTQWICLDLDGLPTSYELNDPDGNPYIIKYDIEALLKDMGIGDVSYVLQWSASHGITDTNIRAHIIMLLDRPVSVALVKQWLIQVNHAVPILRAHTTLTKTACSLSWVLDITACQNDKLIYIAPPKLTGIPDPLGKTPRISVVTKKKPHYTFPASVSSITTNRDLTDKRIHELRKAANIPARKITYKLVGPHEVMVKPDASIITEMKQERGFVYFNLNGGDSWGYYHPENNPDYIYSFKGEPVYLTKELLPDYWTQICSTASRTDSDGITYLAFCDRQTSAYWRGTYNAATDDLELYHAKTETILRHFAGQYGVPLADDIPEWDMSFNPHDSVRVDFTNKTINTFQLTQYMRNMKLTTSRKPMSCPPVIMKIMHHALGSDPDITSHFVNWIAFILQYRTMTRTSWVLHGSQGTGKGVLMNQILRPIFGRNQTVVKRLEEFNEQYNAYMLNCFLVFVDEFQIKALVNERGAMSKIKNFITEPRVPVRAMYQGAFEADNFTNWIFASNESDSMTVPANDRRTNVAAFQPNPLQITQPEIDQIESELQAFHDFLIHYPVDIDAAHTPIETTDRNILISISETSLDSTANALREGKMSFFIDQLPTSDKYAGSALNQSRIDDYKATLRDILIRTDPVKGKVNISRDELQSLFKYCNDKVPESPNKFTTMLKHHRVYTTKVRIADKSVYGLPVIWSDFSQFPIYAKDHFTPAKAKAKTK
jgi:hypothetical protein